MMVKVSRTTPTTISKPAAEMTKAARSPNGQDRAKDVGEHSHKTQEERTRKGDASLHLGQVFLRGGTANNTRDLGTLFFQCFTIILLGEQHIRVEEGKRNHQDKEELPDRTIRCR